MDGWMELLENMCNKNYFSTWKPCYFFSSTCSLKGRYFPFNCCPHTSSIKTRATELSTNRLWAKADTHILHSICIVLLIEVVVKCSHVGLFEICLEKKKQNKKETGSWYLCLNWTVRRKDRNRSMPLTDLDLARLPRVCIVLEMSVRVLEVAGSYRHKKSWLFILPSCDCVHLGET